jgi:hypothetical protein
MAELEHVKGLPELRAKFQQISKDVGTKVLRRGSAAGALLLRDAVKEAAPIRKSIKRYGRFRVPPGTLKAAAIRKFIRQESTPTQSFYIVTFRQGKRYQKSGRDAFYAKWVERGHRVVPRRPKGFIGSLRSFKRLGPPPTRFVPGRFFMARAVEANAGNAAQRMVGAMDVEIRKVDGIT